MTINSDIALWSIGVLFAIGGAWWDTKSKLARFQEMLGNGKPGIFVRKTELDLLMAAREKDHTIFREEIRDLWEIVKKLEDGGNR